MQGISASQLQDSSSSGDERSVKNLKLKVYSFSCICNVFSFFNKKEMKALQQTIYPC